MKTIITIFVKTILAILLLATCGICQEKISRVAVGPNGNQYRYVIAFVETSEAAFKLQSLIIDIAPIKNNQDTPKSVMVDLTSTVRDLASGGKKQKILQLRWDKSGKLELKCDGKWMTQKDAAKTANIVETVNSVIKSLPLKTEPAAEAVLPDEIEKKVVVVLSSMETEELPCLRNN